LLKKHFPKTHAFSRAHRYDLYFEVHDIKYLPFRYFLYINLDKIIFISEHGRTYFTKLFHLKETGKLTLSRLGVKNNFYFKPIQPNRNSVLKIVSCSYIELNKRVDLIAEALSVLDLNIEWVHIGNGLKKPDFESTNNRVTELINNKNNIKYTFTGHMSNMDIFEFYQNNHFDLFINLSNSEGLPVSIMEAMSFGIPVIATSVGGTPEIVEHGYNGLLLHPESSPQEIAKSIELFHSMKDEEYQKFCSNAYQTWLLQYNAEINYKDFTNKILQF
jgi:glycosyltransferase involved in cell wall biosynthesis